MVSAAARAYPQLVLRRRVGLSRRVQVCQQRVKHAAAGPLQRPEPADTISPYLERVACTARPTSHHVCPVCRGALVRIRSIE